MATDDENNQKLSQLQLYEQSLQNILLQKQQFQSQMTELDSALGELKGSEISYRIIGNIMVKTAKDDLARDLEGKRSRAELRIKAIEKQEKTIKEKVKALQSEVIKNMK